MPESPPSSLRQAPTAVPLLPSVDGTEGEYGERNPATKKVVALLPLLQKDDAAENEGSGRHNACTSLCLPLVERRYTSTSRLVPRCDEQQNRIVSSASSPALLLRGIFQVLSTEKVCAFSLSVGVCGGGTVVVGMYVRNVGFSAYYAPARTRRYEIIINHTVGLSRIHGCVAPGKCVSERRSQFPLRCMPGSTFKSHNNVARSEIPA